MSQATYGEEQEVTGWVGWIAFAGTMMIIAGTLNLFYGLIVAGVLAPLRRRAVRA